MLGSTILSLQACWMSDSMVVSLGGVLASLESSFLNGRNDEEMYEGRVLPGAQERLQCWMLRFVCFRLCLLQKVLSFYRLCLNSSLLYYVSLLLIEHEPAILTSFCGWFFYFVGIWFLGRLVYSAFLKSSCDEYGRKTPILRKRFLIATDFRRRLQLKASEDSIFNSSDEQREFLTLSIFYHGLNSDLT